MKTDVNEWWLTNQQNHMPGAYSRPKNFRPNAQIDQVSIEY